MKDIDELNANVFELFNKDWALLTAGSIGDYNAMTIGWGQLGTLWNKSVVTVFVSPCATRTALWRQTSISPSASIPKNTAAT